MMTVAQGDALKLNAVADMYATSFLMAVAYYADMNYTEKMTRPKREAK